MVSIRQQAQCIGLDRDFSVVGDYFGYASPPPWTQAPSQTGLPQSLSVLTQAKRLKKTHVHLNLIRVGTDADGLMTPQDEENLDCAVDLVRGIYAAIGVGIGRVERWWCIPDAWDTGYETIDDDGEAEDLVDDYTVGGGGVDVFFVPLYVGSVVGLTPGKGDGVVVESREDDFLGTARTFGHELGHYFGLGHENGTPDNLMCQTQFANPMPGSTKLNADQTETVKDADDMHGAC